MTLLQEREREGSGPRESVYSMNVVIRNSYLFFKMGVRRGRRSLMGGVIFVIPMTLTIA